MTRLIWIKRSIPQLGFHTKILAYLTSLLMLGNTAAANETTRARILQALREFNNLRTWKIIKQNEPQALHLYTLPFFTDRIELFQLENTQTEYIGRYLLSQDNSRLVVDISRYDLTEKGAPESKLHVIDIANPTSPIVSTEGPWWASTFLGPTRILLIHQSQGAFLWNLQDKSINTLPFKVPLGAMSYATTNHTGSQFLYDVGDDFMICNLEQQACHQLEVEGDSPILSPDGQWILFTRGGFVGSYYLMNIDSHQETLMLSKKKIKRAFGNWKGYADLNFLSWSPDGRFILFAESSDLDANRLFALEVPTKELIEITQELLIAQ